MMCAVNAWSVASAVWIFAVLCGHVHGIGVPTYQSCEEGAARMVPQEFVRQALGGSAQCATGSKLGQCCHKVAELFGDGGSLAHCMCNPEFFSTMLLGLPGQNGVSPDAYVDMLTSCSVPILGGSLCPSGQDGGSQPRVQSMILGRMILKRLLAGGSGSGAMTPPPPPPPPPSAPAPAPAPAHAPVSTYTYVPAAAPSTPMSVTTKIVRTAPAAPTSTGMPSEVMPPPTPQMGTGPSPPASPSSSSSPLPPPSPMTMEPAPSPSPSPISTPEVPESTGTPGTDCKSVRDYLKETADVSIFLQLLEVAGLADALGPFFEGTVFAPTNSAFDELLEELGLPFDVLMDARSRELVGSLLKLHIIADNVARSGSLSTGQNIITLLGGGEALTFDVGEDVMISGVGNRLPAKVVIPDIEACEAIVHVVDRVLIPSPKITAFSG